MTAAAFPAAPFPTAIVFPPPLTIGLIVGLEVFALGVALWLAAPWVARRRPNAVAYVAIARTIAVVAGGVLVVAAIVGEQTPYSDLRNPVPDTVTSVAAGQALYDANCSRCHGVDARGGGPDAGTTQVRPADLRSGHLDYHTDGDIYYWISNGLPGGMPAWASKLSEADRWNLVNYLRAINGRGPSPSPAAPASGASPPAGSPSAGLLFAPGFALVVLGWLGAGARRRRRR